MASYSYPTQVKIVVAAMAIHSFIIEQKFDDEILKTFEDEDCHVNNSDCENMDDTPNTFDDTEMGVIRNRIRDEIVSSREER